MAEPRARPLYSYRDDAAVPHFDDLGPIAIMDGDCTLCALQLDDLLAGFPLEWEGQRVARFQLEHPPSLDGGRRAVSTDP